MFLSDESNVQNSTEEYTLDFISFDDIKNVFKRHKYLIGTISLVSFIGSFLYGNYSKPVYEGYLEIVINRDNKSDLSSFRGLIESNPALASLPSLSSSSSSTIQTQIKILQSPSVLFPVYDYVRKHKIKEGKDVSNWTYREWVKEKLPIKRNKQTTVITLKYRDSDKDFILDVVNKVSNEYQKYSIAERKEKIKQDLKYYNKQVADLKIQADTSVRKADQFALKNNLPLYDGLPSSVSSNTAFKSTNQLPLTQQINLIQSENKYLNSQIKSIISTEEKAVYFASQFPSTLDIYKKYQELSNNLARMKLYYKPVDKRIKLYEKEKSVLESFIAKQVVSYLETKIKTNQARLSTLFRPDDVILKYKELTRKAIRDEKSLYEFDSMLQFVKFENSRRYKPWKLITEPQLFERQVGPRKLRILVGSVFTCTLIAYIIALLIDNNSKKVYNLDKYTKYLNSTPSFIIENNNTKFQNDILFTFANKSNLMNLPNISILLLGNIPDDKISILVDNLANSLTDTKIDKLINVNLINKDHFNILVSMNGCIDSEDLVLISNQIKIKDIKFNEWIHFYD